MPSIVISGTTSGIGLATARHFHALGWRVFAGILPGEDTSAILSDVTERLILTPLDITRGDSIQAAFQQIARAVGDEGVTALVNNAGIGLTGPMETLPMEALRQVMEVNFFGHVAVTQAMLPLVRRARGRIVNIGSILGRLVVPFSGPYSASKYAMEAFTEALRIELRPDGIHISIIEPTIIRTPIWEKQADWQEEYLAEMTPNERNLYGERLVTMRANTIQQAQLAVPAERIAEAIAHAVTARQPQTRYVIGGEARTLLALAKFVPDRLRDQILLRRLGLWR